MISNLEGLFTLMRREVVRFTTVGAQTVFPPLISSGLFMFIFGVTIGSRISIGQTGWDYFSFLIPGLVTMHAISSSYENTSSSLFIGRWHNHIQEVLLSPLSYFEMVLGLLTGGIVRGMVVATGVFLVSLFFSPMTILHPLLLLYLLTTITIIFSCAGMLVALWAEDFNMLTVWNTYLIVPLVMLGGVFHPVEILPPILQNISKFNPMFYLVSAVRYAVTGVSGTSQTAIWATALGMLLLAISIFYFTIYLFKIGYKLRT
ncbi:MAG: ABC transporter permease [Candidatus Omnitrophota bacterium]